VVDVQKRITVRPPGGHCSQSVRLSISIHAFQPVGLTGAPVARLQAEVLAAIEELAKGMVTGEGIASPYQMLWAAAK
jgi:hypothetical protein